MYKINIFELTQWKKSAESLLIDLSIQHCVERRARRASAIVTLKTLTLCVTLPRPCRPPAAIA